MDARNMSLIPDQCFDLVIDKGLLQCSTSSLHSFISTFFVPALFDSLLCSMKNFADIRSLLQEVCRVLKFGNSDALIHSFDVFV